MTDSDAFREDPSSPYNTIIFTKRIHHDVTLILELELVVVGRP